MALAAACALASLVVVRAVRDYANRRALHDRPNERSSHRVPTPRLGGIGILIPLLLTGAGLIITARAPPGLWIPLGAVALIALLGLADDLKPIPAAWRFGAQSLLASMVVAAAWPRLSIAAGPLGWLPTPLLGVLAVVWITWLTNLYNFMDGIDGLAGGQALIASAALAAVAAGVGSSFSGWLLVALAGSSLGFLIWNFPPASIFLGDVGSTAIGFFFGILPLLPDAAPVPLGAVALALSLFVLDATTTLLWRIAKGEKWYAAHRSHLYQRPVVAGVAHRTVTLVAWAAMGVVAACAASWSGGFGPRHSAIASVPLVLFFSLTALVWRLVLPK